MLSFENMPEENTSPGEDLSPDEDVQFERDKESQIVPLTETENAVSSDTPAGETTLPDKEETLGKSDFPPLSELEKKPKLDEELNPKAPDQTD